MWNSAPETFGNCRKARAYRAGAEPESAAILDELGRAGPFQGSICIHEGETIIKNAGSSLLSRNFAFQGNHVFREQNKRLAVPGPRWAILPGAVRQYEVE